MSGSRGADELRIARMLRTRGVGPDAEPQPQPDLVTAAAAAERTTAPVQPQPTAAAAEDGWWQALYGQGKAAAAEDQWWDALYEEEPEPAADDGQAAQPPARSRGANSRIPPWWSGRSVNLTDDEEGEEASVSDEEDEADEEDEGQELADEELPDAEDQDEDAEPGPQPPHRSRSRVQRSQPAPRSRSRSRSTHGPRALVDEPAAPRRSLVDAYAAIPSRIRWLIFHGSAAAAGYRIGWVDYATRTAAWVAEHGYTDRSSLFWYGVTAGCIAAYRRAHARWIVWRWLATVPLASIATGTLLYGTGWTDLHLELPL